MRKMGMAAMWKKISNIITIIITVAVFSLLIFTIISATTFDQQTKGLFGYKLFIVTSDSMRATDFATGDLIVIGKIDPTKLQPGDIISYISENPLNYGKNVTHKIREIHKNAQGDLEFVTYGTTSGVNDELRVPEDNVIGIYRMRIPKAGLFFAFIKTTPGYILFVLLPFLIMTVYYGIKGVMQFRRYRKCEMEELQKEREEIEAYKKAYLQLRTQEQGGELDEDQE